MTVVIFGNDMVTSGSLSPVFMVVVIQLLLVIVVMAVARSILGPQSVLALRLEEMYTSVVV